MQEEQYDMQGVIQQGEEAARVLGSQLVNVAYRMVTEELTAAIYNAKPEDVNDLREIRRQGNSLAAVFAKLNHMARMAEAEMMKQQQQPQEY